MRTTPIREKNGRANFIEMVKKCICPANVLTKERRGLESFRHEREHTFVLTIICQERRILMWLVIRVHQLSDLLRNNKSSSRRLKDWWRNSRHTNLHMTLKVALWKELWLILRNITSIVDQIVFMKNSVNGCHSWKHIWCRIEGGCKSWWQMTSNMGFSGHTYKKYYIPPQASSPWNQPYVHPILNASLMWQLLTALFFPVICDFWKKWGPHASILRQMPHWPHCLIFPEV